MTRTVMLLVPGVLQGSTGPLEYPAEVVALHPWVWEGVPLTLAHRGPTIGRVLNARVVNGCLLADISTEYELPGNFEVSAGLNVRLRGSTVVDYEADHVAIVEKGAVNNCFSESEFLEYERRYR